MKTERVIKLVDTHRPKDITSALYCGLPLKYAGDGAYRTAYEVVGTNLVIKFPKNDEGMLIHNQQHSLHEYQAILKVLRSKAKSLQALRKHMPKVYYCNRDGVMIVRKYKLLSEHRKADKIRALLSQQICKVLKLYSADLENSGNVGIDGRGTLKVLDAGFLGDQW